MKKRQYRLVKDASDWKDMDGDNDLEKQLNSYLTCRFILTASVPSDECLTEAKEIIDIIFSFFKSHGRIV
jgi:hypothetical protein